MNLSPVCPLAFLLLAWLLPNHYFPWAAAYQDFLAAAALLATGAFAALRSPGRLVLPKSSLFLALVALVPLIQAATGLVFFTGDALLASLYLLAFAFAIVVSCNLSSRDAGRELSVALAAILLVGAFLSGTIELIQWLRIGNGSLWIIDLPPEAYPWGNLGQHNQQSTLLCLGLASTWFLFERRVLNALGAWALSLWFLPLIAVTQSRSSFLGMLLALALLLLASRRVALRTPKKSLFAGLVLHLSFFIALPFICDGLLLSGGDLLGRAQPGNRPIFWAELLEAARHRPLTGWGWNQVAVAQVEFAQKYPISELVEHAHNLFLDLVVWNGLVIGGLILTLAAWWGWTSLRALSRLEAVFGFSILCFIFGHSLVEFPYDYLYFLVPLGLAIGLIEANAEGGFLAPMPARPALLFATLLGLVAVAAIWMDYRVAEEESRALRFESARIGRDKPVVRIDRIVFLDQQREFLRFARTLAHPGMSAAQIESMRRVAHRYPYPPALFRYALALAQNGRLDEAVLELARLRQLHGKKLFDEAVGSLAQMGERAPLFGELARRAKRQELVLAPLGGGEAAEPPRPLQSGR